MNSWREKIPQRAGGASISGERICMPFISISPITSKSTGQWQEHRDLPNRLLQFIYHTISVAYLVKEFIFLKIHIGVFLYFARRHKSAMTPPHTGFHLDK